MDALAENPLYIVLIIALVVWLGVFAYLVRMDARVRELEKHPPQKHG